VGREQKNVEIEKKKGIKEGVKPKSVTMIETEKPEQNEQR